MSANLAAPHRRPPISSTPASSSCQCRSTGPRPMSPAPATVRTRFWWRPPTWSCGTRKPATDVHSIGIFTMPEMEFPFATMDEVIGEIRRVASEIVSRGKFPFVIGGEHSITAPVVGALVEHHPGLSVLQIDAHADLRQSFMGTPHNHACAMRRVLDYAPRHAGRHPQPLSRGSRGRAVAPDDHLLRFQHAAGSATGSIASSSR